MKIIIPTTKQKAKKKMKTSVLISDADVLARLFSLCLFCPLLLLFVASLAGQKLVTLPGASLRSIHWLVYTCIYSFPAIRIAHYDYLMATLTVVESDKTDLFFPLSIFFHVQPQQRGSCAMLIAFSFVHLPLQCLRCVSLANLEREHPPKVYCNKIVP